MNEQKECFKCSQSKPRSEFYRHKRMGDGLLGKCKECTKADVRRNRSKRVGYYRQYDLDRSERQRAYAKNHPEKLRARAMVARHLAKGNMTRKPCEVCGDIKVDGHHEDYSRPLDVRWLCRRHHSKRHEELRSEESAPEDQG